MLRNRLGSTYGADVDYTPLRGAGLLLVHAAVDRERAGETFIAMRKALDEIRSGDFTEEFIRARRLVVQRLLASTINSRTVANRPRTAGHVRLQPPGSRRHGEASGRASPGFHPPAGGRGAGRRSRGRRGRGAAEDSVAAMYKAAGIELYESVE